MIAWMLRITGVVIAMDLLWAAYFITPFALALLIFVPLFFWGAKKLKNEETSIEASGWVLGRGLDIANPEHPVDTVVTLEDKAIDLGLLCVGGPGSGKSIMAIGLLKYLCEQRNGGWTYWEGKGDLDIYQRVVACGAAPDRFFSSELISSDSINVFAGSAESVIDRLSRALIASESEYYGNAQRSALRRVVPLLKALEMPVVLRDLYVVLMVPEAAMYVLNLARERGVKSDVIESARQFFSIEDKERNAQIHGLLNRMDAFATGQIAERLNAYEPTLDLVDAAKRGLKVYLHLPYTQLARDIAIMLTEEIGTIATHRQLYDKNRVAWPQVFDDWGAFFYDNFGPITSRCRSAKMPVNFLFQSRGQTDKVDGNRIFTTEITDNIGGLCIFRINGQETAEWAARQFGTFETREVSHSTAHNGSNITTVEKPRVRGDQLKDMDQGEAYVNCLVMGERGRVDNKRYQVRFPLPDFNGYENVDWPVINSSSQPAHSNGLHLWRDFMDRDRLNDLRQRVVEEAEQAANTVPKKRKLPTKAKRLQDVDF